jgi:rfaE bifunctional protein nucleotidyltransferase chain/domain
VSAAPAFEAKLTPPQEIVRKAAVLVRPIVFTNGVFDLLHRGHVTYLAQARALGQSLIVALNDDDSTRRLGKAPDRPINTLADRAAVIAALESVSLVTWFTEDTPLSLIQALSPQILVKGGDWPIQNIVGADWVMDRGGQVFSIAFEHLQSTSKVLEKIRHPSI